MATSSMSNILLDKEILLESGTNELEVLVFDVADYTFGINVAKVREVLPATEITGLPRAHSSIRGVFKLRNSVIPCVSLLDHLGIVSTRENAESTMILTDFNQQQTAFLVDGVERIHRLSWENILSVPGLEALANTPVTALARCDQRLIVMLDFEMILDDVTEQYFRTDPVDNPLGLPREQLKILLAEDSPTVRVAVGTTLRASGYTHLAFFDNGQEAWEWMTSTLRRTEQLEEVCDLVISDVEMPQVDGFHLTKRIKEHPQLKQLPVLLYSSIVTPDNRKKGIAVGADAQVSKPELKEVVRLADELISNARQENRGLALRQATQAAESLVAEGEEEGLAEQPPGSSVPPTSHDAPSPEAVGLPPGETAEPLAATAEPLPPPVHVPAPEGVDVRLWQTFHQELHDRAAELYRMLDQASAGGLTDELFRAVARTLHTIKSAAMVVPLDAVTHCTHLAENLLEMARDDRSQWPQQQLVRYLDWLKQLLSPPGDLAEVLRAAEQLKEQLADCRL